MNLDTLYPSKYLKSGDIGDVGASATYVIACVQLEAMKNSTGKEEQKPVLYFEGENKGLVMNLTNAKTIGKLYGKNIDSWTGKAVTLFVREVEAFNETHQVIRIKNEIPAQSPMVEEAIKVGGVAALDAKIKELGYE